MSTLNVRTAPQAFWLKHLACPQCRAALSGTDYCLACGIAFRRDGSVPVLISEQCQRTVAFPFSQRRSVSDDELSTVLRVPARPATLNDLPYHFDPAHAHVAQGLARGSNVLEIGCGGGQCRAWFTKRGHNYVGTDISRSRVSQELRTHGGPDVLADAHFLPFKDESFDMVYSAAVTEHLACPLLMAQEVRRVLKPGGYFCSNVSFMEPWHDASFYHMSPLGVYELLMAAGLEVKSIWPGEGWGAFRAISRMAFAGPFRILRIAGRIADGIYNAQVSLQRRRRRAMGKAEDGLALKARTAGAVAWIAVRGAAGEEHAEAREVVSAAQ